MTDIMKDIDTCINTSINRLSKDESLTNHVYYIDLHKYQKRITKKLINSCIETCNDRGLTAERTKDGLNVYIDLNTCTLRTDQADAYNTSLLYARTC